MRFVVVLFVGLLLAAGAARAQEAGSGWLGVELANLTKEEADVLGWEAPRGAKVVKPVPGGPAEAAGVQAGDVLVTFDGVEIENVRALIEAIAKKAPSTEIRLAIQRAGREKRLALKLGARPAQLAAAKPKLAEDAPIPMLDTGGHMALITGIAFTPDGKQLVSVSYDKTIRVWDLATGKTVRIMRGDAEPGNVGQLFALALSPDGKWVAAGGWTHQECAGRCGEIRLYDFASGKLAALLKGHGNTVLALAFSPNGQHLISGSFDKTAIIWDVAAAKMLRRLEGHRERVTAVGFTSDGQRVVTASNDHDLRLWAVESGALLATMTGHTDELRSLAVAPNGSIASGDNSGEIRLWDGRTGKFLKTVVQPRPSIDLTKLTKQESSELEAALQRFGKVGGANVETLLNWFTKQKVEAAGLSFSPDGKLLYGDTVNNYHLYDIATGKDDIRYAKKQDSYLVESAISPDGRWAATATKGDQEIHVWSIQTGTVRKTISGLPLILRGSGQPVQLSGFSKDGRKIEWNYVVNSLDFENAAWQEAAEALNSIATKPQYALTLRSGNELISGPNKLSDDDKKDFVGAIISLCGRSLRLRNGGFFDPVIDIYENGSAGKSISAGNGNSFRALSFSFAPGCQTIIAGGGYNLLSAYDLAGTKLGDFIGHEADVMSATPSPDGRYLVSGSGDQTVRLWNLKTRELIVTLFRGTDSEWMMWTPQGYFAASPGGAGLIGWHINHGPEHEADYVTAAQLRKSLNRPDIVAKAIQLASAEEAEKQSPGTNFKLSGLLAKPVPRFRIISPAANATLTGGAVQLELALEETPDPVNLIRLYVNGVQIEAHQPDEGAGPGFKPGKLTFSVPLAKGRNLIRAVAVNETGETSAEVAVDLAGEGALDKRGTLRILAIGVDKYPGLGKACVELDGVTPKSCDLSSAVSDASAFANAMAARLGPLHQSVVSTVLVNGGARGEPKAANIVDALDELRGAGTNDTIMLFVSGHGFHEDQDYYFVPTDAAFASGRLRKSTAVPWTQFQSVLEGAKGRRFLFLDTCRSGNRYSQRLTNDAYEQNIVVYAAARWDQDALESNGLGGGIFTYALVEGVKGKAKDGAGEVRVESLRDYVRARVAELAKPLGFEQEPQFVKGRDAENYLLTRGQ